jgi:hypothetical protein
MLRFKVGNKVRCINQKSSGDTREVGIIRLVVPNDDELDAFSMYEVEFPDRRIVIYGSQLAAQPTE